MQIIFTQHVDKIQKFGANYSKIKYCVKFLQLHNQDFQKLDITFSILVRLTAAYKTLSNYKKCISRLDKSFTKTKKLLTVNC